MYNFQAQTPEDGILNPFRCTCKDTSKSLKRKHIHPRAPGWRWSQTTQKLVADYTQVSWVSSFTENAVNIQFCCNNQFFKPGFLSKAIHIVLQPCVLTNHITVTTDLLPVSSVNTEKWSNSKYKRCKN